MADDAPERPSAIAVLRRLLGLERDVLVLSLAMFAFSLGFQMTGRYMPRYLSVLGAGGIAIGAFKSLSDLLSALYPYPGGALSDRIGSRTALTLFGFLSTLGFGVWLAAPAFGTPEVFGTVVPVGVFLGLFLVQAWKSLGLGATFAVVKQSTTPETLASGFASTETVRRVAFLVGPLVAAALLASGSFTAGFRWILAIGGAVALVGTIAQYRLYDPAGDTIGKSFEGIEQVVGDLRGLPPELPPLLAGDTLVRFANGMVYAFFVIVVTELRPTSVVLPVVGFLNPDAFFGVLLSVEMAVALLTMVPVAAMTRRTGLKPVVALGFLVYAAFPVILISAPATPVVLAVLFAISGLRFAGLPAHKALIVGPAAAGAGGRVTGSYYLVRNAATIPAGVVGGILYTIQPALAFSLASAVGLVGVALFLVYGREFEALA